MANRKYYRLNSDHNKSQKNKTLISKLKKFLLSIIKSGYPIRSGMTKRLSLRTQYSNMWERVSDSVLNGSKIKETKYYNDILFTDIKLYLETKTQGTGLETRSRIKSRIRERFFTAFHLFRMTVFNSPLERGLRGVLYNRPKRNRLTASVLTFIMIFNIVVGVFAPINIFHWEQKAEANAAWYNENGTWGYRKSITIDHTKVSNADQAYFPVLISLTDPSLKDTANGGKVTNSNGYDIIFTSNNGSTKLDHETEKYVPSTGELKAWVKIPILSASTDTIIYIYYGNSNIATSQENKTAVWDDGGSNNFKMVQHMNQDPSGTAPQMIDSTQYANNGTSYGMDSSNQVTGQIDGATIFDGVNEYMATPNMQSSSSGSVSIWVKPDFNQVGDNRNQTLFWTSSQPGVSPYRDRLNTIIIDKLNTAGGGDNLYFRVATDTQSNTIGGGTSWFIQNQPVYITMTWASGTLSVYKNSSLFSSRSITGTVNFSAPVNIGRDPSYYFDATLDEVRISNTARSASWIATEYANQSRPDEFYTLGIEEVSSPATLSSFGYRKAITIDHTKVSADLVNFPVLVNLPTDTSLASHAQADADDILFTTSATAWNSGTTNDKLPHEIEKYTSATGSLQAWVKIPNLSSTTDTVIYMYYGNSGVTSQQNKTVVWDSNTKMVQHMSQDPSGTAPQMLDSTQYANNGTSAGTMTSGDLVTGKIGSAIDFDGVNDYVNMGDVIDIGIDDFTTGSWVKTSGISRIQRVFMKLKDDSLGFNGYNFRIDASGRILGYIFYHGAAHEVIASNLAVNDNLWHYIAFTIDRDNVYGLTLYVDGVETTYTIRPNPVSFNNLDIQNSGNLYIGTSYGAATDFFIGQLDEVRISNTARSADWIATEYANQSKPDEFYTLGIEEVSSPATLSSFGYRKAITIDHTKVSGDLVNFPVLVNLPTDASLAAHAQADSDDILFTTSNIAWNSGTTNDKLPHEVEKYTSATGSLQAWVKIPNLSSTTDTVIYMYYGNSGVTTQQNKTAVWDNNTKLVQHMNQTGTGTVGDYQDSTQYANNSANTANQPTVTTSGQIGNAQSFNGTSQYLELGNSSSLDISNNLTTETWVYLPNGYSVASNNHMFVLSRNGWIQQSFREDSGGFSSALGNSSSLYATKNIWSAGWYHLVASFDGTNQRIYINGVLNTSSARSPIFTNSNSLYIGTYYSPGLRFSGSIDEVRISNTARSASWIATEYANQSKPDEFYTLGIEEVSSPATLSSFAYRKAITIDHTKVSGDLVNFPVLVNLPTDASLSTNAQTDSDDILFTTSSASWNTGTINDKLPHEIEKYTSATGNLQAWVKIPNLSSTTDTVIYMYYGNSGVTSQQNKTAVWDSNTKLVQHMNQDPSGTAPQMLDSTQYANNGTSAGTMTSGDLVTGQIDGATDFDGVDDRVQIGSFQKSPFFSISLWTKFNSYTQNTYAGMVFLGNSNNGWGIVSNLNGNNKISARVSDGINKQDWAIEDLNSINYPSGWHNIVIVSNGSTLSYYKNGLFIASTSQTVTNTGVDILSIGKWGSTINPTDFFSGLLDEVRISNTARSASWITTEYANQSKPDEFYTLGIEEVSSPATLSSFGYRKAITIDHTKVSGDLVNFPVLVNLPTDASLASQAQADADDILFTTSSVAWNSGTTNDKLPHEIEKYTTATGNLQAWVKIPNLSSTTDTVIYMYYGNASVTTQQNKTAVWDNNTKLVQHMNQDPSGTAPQMLDSTQYANNGTSYGTMTSGDLVTGQIDGATDFDGVDDYINAGNGDSLNIAEKITIEAWAKIDLLDSQFRSIVDVAPHYPLKITTGNQIRFQVYTVNGVNAFYYTPQVDNLYHLVLTYDYSDSANGLIAYVNGARVGNRNVYSGLLNITPNTPWFLTRLSPPTYPLDGYLDEVRISNTARSASWISTEFNNQSSPSTFYDLSEEQIYNLTLTGSSSQTAGNTQTLTLTAKDALGNTMTSFSGDKTVTLSGASAAPDTTLPTCTDKDGVAVPFGTSTTLTFTNGIASCNLRLYKAESATITTPTLSSTTTNLAVTVSPATLNNFQINAPALSNSGQAFSTVITSRDAYDNTTTTVTGTTDITVNYGTISPTSISSSNFTDDGTYTHDFTINNITEQPTITITATNDIYTGTDNISILGIPQAPSSASASKNSDYSITLTWQDNSTVETGYRIERKENSGSGFGAYTEIGTVLASVTTFTDDASSNPGNTPYPDRSYQYRVRAYNSIGNSASYSEDPVIQYTTPDVPSNISSAFISDTSFSVSYADNANVTDTHRIQRCSNANCGSSYETDLNTFASSPQTDNASLFSNGRYRWQVRAETPNSNSNYAASGYEFTTPSTPTIGTPVYIPGTGITVNWTDNSSYEDGFRIEVSTNGGAYTEITPSTNTVGANIQTYTFNSLPDSNYKFKVRSHIGSTTTNPELLSAYSAESATVYTSSASPVIGTPTINSSTSITWNWTDISAFEELFHLDFTTGNGLDIDDIAANSTSYASTGLSVNTQYAVHIHSCRSDTGESEPSANSSSVYTLSNLPSNLTLTVNGQEQITTNWNANSNPEGTEYYIENINLGTNSNWISSTSWISSNLHCGIEYSFRVKSRNHDNVETAYSDISSISTDNCSVGFPTGYTNPPASPIATSDNPAGELKVVINSNAKYANTSKVNLTLYAGKDTTRMAISNTADFKDASLIPYQKEYEWDLNADCHCEEGLCPDAAISSSEVMATGLPRDLTVARNDTGDSSGNGVCEGTHTVYAKFYTKYGVASNVVSDSIILDTTIPTINISNFKNAYLPTEKIVLKGTTEPNLKVFFNLNNTIYGIVNSDSSGNFTINLNPLTSGSHALRLIAEDEAKNSSDTLTLTLNVQIPTVKQTPIDNPPVSDSEDNPTETEETNETPLIPNTNPETPAQAETPTPIPETPLPPEAPASLQGEWNLLSIKPLPQAFTSSELSSILSKFPELKDTFSKLGITDLKNEQLQNASFSLPGLSQVLSPSSLEEANILYLTNLAPELKKDVPFDVIFVRTANETIDLNSFLTFENSNPNQKISLLQNQSFELILRPENPAKSIKGYVTFKSENISYTEPENSLEKLASLLGVKAIKAEENNIEEKLVLSEFNFQDEDQDGLWTANFQTPQVTGEYEVITVMEYQDISLGSKTLRLITVIDPEGYVYEQNGNKQTRIPEAVVSLYRFNSDTKQYELWNAGTYQQINPQITDESGTYSFLVPPGSYYLRVEAPGYEAYQGNLFEVTLGSGIHTNIELTPQKSWQDVLNGERILIIAFGISLFYYVRRDRMIRKKNRD